MKKMLMLVAILIASVGLGDVEYREENVNKYGYCTVLERIDPFTDDKSTVLTCVDDPLRETTASISLVIRPDPEEDTEWTNVLMFWSKSAEYEDDTVNVRYRFGEMLELDPKLHEGQFHTKNDGSAWKELDDDQFNDILDLVGGSRDVIFDLGEGAQETVKLGLLVKKALEDFQARVKKLKGEEDEEPEESEQEDEELD